MRYYIYSLLLAGLLQSGIVNAEAPTLRDKIGQMLIMGFYGKEVDRKSPIINSIKKDNIGGVILFDYDYQTKQFDRNIENPSQVKKLNNYLQKATAKANKVKHRPKLPLLISVDYEGGKVTRLREEYGFPRTYSAAEIGKKTLFEAMYAADNMADTLKESGFNLNFAPSLDVNTNPDNPIIGSKERSFSDKPDVVVNYGRVYAEAFLKKGIQCTYKHFPGHGSSTTDSHLGFVDVSETWSSKELEPFQSLLKEPQGCGMVMTAHIVNQQLDSSGLPATLSHAMLTGVLREQLGYKGVIITDDMQMKAISDNYKLEDSLTLAINAGADMLIFGNQLSEKPQDATQIIDIIEAKVLSGEISENRIDCAYKRIVTLKESLVSDN